MSVTDPYSPDRPHRPPTRLGPFAEASVLSSADTQVAGRLIQVAGADGLTALGAALAVRAVRQGNVCVDLTTIAATATPEDEELADVDIAGLPWPDPAAWRAALEASGCVAVGDSGQPDRPLRLVGDLLYLDRYWRDERAVVSDLLGRSAQRFDIDADELRAGIAALFGPPTPAEPDLQRLAAAAAVLRGVSVIAGGPGTGKTYTVSRVLALLFADADRTGHQLRVAMAAPTGKAAARLQEAVHREAELVGSPDGMAASDTIRDRLLRLEASTLHRLLGRKPGSNSRFRHDRQNQLPHNVVIVDETSMVSLSMMARLLAAVRDSARLVLVGDPQQLASVEAGAVLGDIVGPARERLHMRSTAIDELAAVTGEPVDASVDDREHSVGDGIVVLERIHRFGGGIAEFATAIEQGDGARAIELLRSADHRDLAWQEVDVADPGAIDTLRTVRTDLVTNATAVVEAARAGDSATAVTSLRAAQLLCAHRRGPHGVAFWRNEIEGWLAEALPDLAHRGWYAGRPLLVTENDYNLELFNGDTGVVVDRGDRLVAAFERRGQPIEVSPARLAAVETLYAMTIHKSQGSEFGSVTVILPDETSPILTRELLYTAVTRAKERLTIVGTEVALLAAIDRPIARASGLRDRLWNPADLETGF